MHRTHAQYAKLKKLVLDYVVIKLPSLRKYPRNIPPPETHEAVLGNFLEIY